MGPSRAGSCAFGIPDSAPKIDGGDGFAFMSQFLADGQASGMVEGPLGLRQRFGCWPSGGGARQPGDFEVALLGIGMAQSDLASVPRTSGC